MNVISVGENPTINWPFPEPIAYGNVISELQLNASANVPGTFAYSPTNGAVLNAGVNQPLTAIFTPAAR